MHAWVIGVNDLVQHIANTTFANIEFKLPGICPFR